MTEKIGVTYLSVIGGTYHMALFYQDSAGQRWVIEAAPQIDMGQVPAAKQLAEVTKETFSSNVNDGSPYGFIVGGVRPWSDALDTQRPAEVLLTGDDLLGEWSTLVAAAGAAFALHYEYRPLQQNSNTFVATLLDNAGLPQPQRLFLDANGSPILDFEGIPIGTYITPASSFRLHDPLAAPALPTELGASDFRFGEVAPNRAEVTVGTSTDVTVEWSNGAVNVAANGVDIGRLVDVPLNDVVDPGASIVGVDGHIVMIGSSGADVLDGKGSDCLVLAGQGDDTVLLGYGGADWVDGGTGSDTARYSQSDDSHTVTISADNNALSLTDQAIVAVTDDVTAAVDYLSSIESIKLSGSDNSVVVKPFTPESISGGLTIDLGATSLTSNDTLDLSQYGAAYLKVLDDGSVGLYSDVGLTVSTGLAFKNFNSLILSDDDNNIDLNSLASPYLNRVVGGAGNDTLTGGSVPMTLIGNAGDDVLTAGTAGDILDGGSGNNQYVGGAGADTFVIGNGTAAASGVDGHYVITNASADDRLVLRLNNALGLSDPNNWIKGIVLNGGVSTISPTGNDPDFLVANYSSILVRPDQISNNGDTQRLISTTLDNVRPDLGFVRIEYDWYKPGSQLSVFVDSSYGSFSVEVDGFQDGQLGLNFSEVDEPKLRSPSPLPSEANDILSSWSAYNNTLNSFIDNTQIVDLPSPGVPQGTAASPFEVPFADTIWWPEIEFPGDGDGLLTMVQSNGRTDGLVSQLIQAMASSPAGAGLGESAGFSAAQEANHQIQLASVA